MLIKRYNFAKSSATRDYETDLLVDIQAIRIALLTRERNAWHSTWVSHRMRDHAMYSDVKSARNGAEQIRKQGNVFSISETPALLLIGEESQVLVADTWYENPFSGFEGIGAIEVPTKYESYLSGIYPGISIRDAMEAFRSKSTSWSDKRDRSGSIIFGEVEKNFNPTIIESSDETTFSGAVSQSVGTSYFLQWSSRPPSYKSKGVKSIRENWNRLASQVDSWPWLSHEEMTAHRISFEILPRSLWLNELYKHLNFLNQSLIEMQSIIDNNELSKTLLELELRNANLELASAVIDRETPGDTSAKVRDQRLRVEAATSSFEALTIELEALRAELRKQASRTYSLKRERNALATYIARLQEA